VASVNNGVHIVGLFFHLVGLFCSFSRSHILGLAVVSVDLRDHRWTLRSISRSDASVNKGRPPIECVLTQCVLYRMCSLNKVRAPCAHIPCAYIYTCTHAHTTHTCVCIYIMHTWVCVCVCVCVVCLHLSLSLSLSCSLSLSLRAHWRQTLCTHTTHTHTHTHTHTSAEAVTEVHGLEFPASAPAAPVVRGRASY
jgi:hypothetical protein